MNDKPYLVDKLSRILGRWAARMSNQTRQRLGEQTRRQTALFRLSAEIATALNEGEICQRVVNGLQDEMLGYACLGLFLVDADTGDRVLRASAGWPQAPADLRLSPGQGLSERALSERALSERAQSERALSERALLDGQLYYSPDVTRAAGYVPALNSGSKVDVPIKIDETVVGVLIVESRQPDAFDQDDFNVLTTAATQAGIALGRARSLAETRQLAAELATINRVGQALASQLELDALIDLVGEQMRQTFDAQIASVALYDHHTNSINFPYHYEHGRKRPIFPLEFGKGLISKIIQTRRPLLLDQEQQRAELYTPIRSFLGVPILVGDEAIGAISVQSMEQEGQFGAADMRLLTTIAANVGVAIRNAQLYREMQRRVDKTAALADVSRASSDTLDLPAVLERIVAYAQDLLTGDTSAVFLQQPDDQTFRAIVAVGEVADEIKALSVPLGSGIIGDIARRGVAEVVDDVRQDPRTVQAVDGPGVAEQALIVAPLLSRHRVTGVMAVWRVGKRDPFTQADLEFLIDLSQQAAIAIENARLFEQTQHRSMQLQTAADVSKSASTILDPDELMQVVVNLIRERFGLYYVGIFLVDEAGEYAVLRAGTGEEGRQMLAADHRFTVGDSKSLVGWSVANSKAALDVGGDAERFDNPELPETRSEAALPLRSRGRTIGAMTTQSTQEAVFSEENISVWQTMADQIAVALDNARLFQETQWIRKAAQEANQAKTTFLANMSHELRTPLNAIIGFTRLVKRRSQDVLPQKQIDNLEKVLLSANYLLELINAVLDISKIEAGRMDVHPVTFNVEMLIDVCMRTIQPLVSSERLGLVKMVESDLPLLFTDQDKVRQILINLLSNAQKFTQAGQITVSAQRRGKALVLSVADTGIGIPEDALERIFEEFQQVDSSTTRRYGGTGLGLSISRHLAQLLGGNITVKSSVGVGSTFTAIVPIRYDDAQPHIADLLLDTPTVQTEERRVVLVIGDDPEVFYTLQEALAETEYDVVGVTDSQQGLQKARAFRPFAIILDVMISTGDGWPILHELKAGSITQDIPIIVLSVVDNKDLGYRLGAVDYLVKPLDCDAIQSALAHIASVKESVHRKRLLVVDDDPLVIRLVRRLLRGEPYEIDDAADGQLALEAISRRRPDIILLDLMMPRLNGFAVIEYLHHDPDYCTIPIVAFTAKSLSNDEKMQLERGTFSIMQKQNLEREDLVRELQQVSQTRNRKDHTDEENSSRRG